MPSPKSTRYPEVLPDAETLEYFRENPTVAGMAIGAGLNDYPGPRRVVANPFTGLNKEQKEGLIFNERIRHLLDESKPQLDFEPTEAQIAAFQSTEYGKPENREQLKRTIVARILTGDESAGFTHQKQLDAAKRVGRMYGNPVTPTNPLSTHYQMSEPLHAPQMLKKNTLDRRSRWWDTKP